MQHGHYVHLKDPDYEQAEEEDREPERVVEPEPKIGDEEEEGEGEEMIQDKPMEETFGEPLPLKKGIIPVWRARCITPYNPDLLPPEPVPLQEEVSLQSLTDKCPDDEPWMEPEEYLKYHQAEYEDEGDYEDAGLLPRSPGLVTHHEDV